MDVADIMEHIERGRHDDIYTLTVIPLSGDEYVCISGIEINAGVHMLNAWTFTATSRYRKYTDGEYSTNGDPGETIIETTWKKELANDERLSVVLAAIAMHESVKEQS